MFHRRGYYAIDPTQLKDYNPNQEAAAALGDALPSTLVAFRVQVKSAEDNAVKGKVGVTFLVDADTLSAEDASGGKRMNVVFYATSYSRDGKMLANHSQKVDQVFNADTYQQVRQRGMMLHMDLDPVPAANQIRLPVQCGRTGMVETLDARDPQSRQPQLRRIDDHRFNLHSGTSGLGLSTGTGKEVHHCRRADGISSTQNPRDQRGMLSYA